MHIVPSIRFIVFVQITSAAAAASSNPSMTTIQEQIVSSRAWVMLLFSFGPTGERADIPIIECMMRVDLFIASGSFRPGQVTGPGSPRNNGALFPRFANWFIAHDRGWNSLWKTVSNCEPGDWCFRRMWWRFFGANLVQYPINAEQITSIFHWHNFPEKGPIIDRFQIAQNRGSKCDTCGIAQTKHPKQ